jgi:glycosyltransferase involved in cell wall biosynthesis
MHILLIHQAFAALDEPGGTRHHELARHLARRGHRVTIIASPVSYLTGKTVQGRVPWVTRQQDDQGVTVLRAYTYAALHRSFVHRVFSFLSFMLSSFLIGMGVKDVDLVWGTSPPIFQAATAWALARLKRAPFVFEVRDLWPAFAVAVGVLRQPLLIRLSEWLEGFLYRHADRVLVNSPGFIQHVKERGATQIVLVPNGAESAMFDPAQKGEAFRRQAGLGSQFVAMYAGAHGMSNDLQVVLEAAALLREREDIVVLLLGDGKDKPKLQQTAVEMGLHNVFFMPPCPKNAMAEALAAADACIAILKPIAMYRTVYPNKVFDYMAAGRPVVLAIEGVIRDVVQGAGAGLCIPPGDPHALAKAVRYLADHPEEGREMGQRGRQAVVQNFDRPALADRLAEILEALVG